MRLHRDYLPSLALLSLALFPLGCINTTSPGGAAGAKGATGTTGSAGIVGATGAQGAVGVTFRGTWLATASYAPTEAVFYNGSTYLAAVTNANMQPDIATTVWSVMAKAGSNGATGSTGVAGLSGAAASVSVGTVTTLPAGSIATVTNSGNATVAVLNFGVPQGASGAAAGAAAIAGPLVRADAGSNLFDASRVSLNTVLNPDGSISAIDPKYAVYTSDYTLCAGLSSVASSGNIGHGIAFYDVNQTFLNYIPPSVSVAAVPASAVYFRFSSSGSPSNAVLVAGSTMPTTYVPYGVVNAAVTKALAAVPLTLGPLAGKNLGILGDSITQVYGTLWMPTVQTRTNATFTYVDALAGRGALNAFADYNNGAAVAGDGSGTNAAGNTLAQDLANVDLLLVEFGTNDGSYYIANDLGSPTNAPSMAAQGTYSAIVGGIIETLLKYKPTLRIVWMSPWQDNPTNGNAGCNSLACSQGVVNAIVATCGRYGIPVINMLTESGIGPATWTTYLADGVHPNAVGGAKVIGPLVGQKLNLYF